MPQPVSTQNNFLPVGIGIRPREPKSIPVDFDFTVSNSQQLDFGNQQMRGVIGWLQSIFIDNYSLYPVTVQFSTLSHAIVVPAQSQMWAKVQCPNPPTVTVSSPYASGRCRIYFTNFYVDDTYRPRNNNGGTLMFNPSFPGGAVDTYVPEFSTGTKAQGSIATGSTNILFASTSAAFYINYINLHLTGNASLAAPGNFVVQVRGTNTVIMQFAAWLDNTPGTTPGNIVLANLSNLRIRHTTPGATLNINLLTPLATGDLFYNIGCGITGVI